MDRWIVEQSRRALSGLGLGLCLAALLIGAVGAHVLHGYVHPAYNAHDDHAGLADGHHCPICDFLGHFHARTVPVQIACVTEWTAPRCPPDVIPGPRRRTAAPFLSRGPPARTCLS
jgi:hypothetical protein